MQYYDTAENLPSGIRTKLFECKYLKFERKKKYPNKPNYKHLSKIIQLCKILTVQLDLGASGRDCQADNDTAKAEIVSRFTGNKIKCSTITCMNTSVVSEFLFM